MHCPSCELLIEKKLLKQDGIESVDATYQGNKVELNYSGDSKPDIDKLNKEFEKYGYKFGDKKIKKNNAPLISFSKDGSLLLNSEKAINILKITSIFFSFLIAFFLFESLQLARYVSVDASSSLPAFFLLGLVAGVSSCAALIGGLLLSMVKQWNEMYIDAESNSQKAEPHVMFHIGRIVSFTLLGGVLGLIGETVSLSNATFFAILTIIVSFIMIVSAMQMLNINLLGGRRVKFVAPKGLVRFVSDESNFKGRYMPFLLGAATFILPCGFTLIAQTAALATGSFIQGALVMLAFSLGTLPILLGISLGGIALNSKPHLTAKFNLIAGLVVLFFALYNINGQMNVLGYPSLSDINLSQPATTDQANDFAEVDATGTQILNVTASGFEYTPTSTMKLKSGTPAKLVVDNQGIQGCATFMAATGLIDNFVTLQPGINIVEIANPKPGTYKLTCTMGMVRPVNIQVI